MSKTAALATYGLAAWLLFMPLAHAGHVDFILVSRHDNGVPQPVNLNYREEARLSITSGGQNTGAYVTYNLIDQDTGSYTCAIGACEFSGRLKAWGIARLDASKTYLIFNYSLAGHKFDLVFRRVRLICPSMFPFC